MSGDSAGGTSPPWPPGRPATPACALAHQVLVYPVLDVAMDTPSYARVRQGLRPDAAEMAWFARQFTPPAPTRPSPSCPRCACRDVSGLASATVVTAGCDVLRDEGERYARPPGEAGVPVACAGSRAPCTPSTSARPVRPGDRAREYVAERLREHL
ncbi:alpha/beta hydrolase fold domain-containing protein [Nonomuraea rubra]|uniref:alpha/beta hydrolase fold domain-containing protein n=1 Tax=Nonomuraea rubra TaxID=46180 RepID=UPI003CD0B05A